MAAGIPGVGIGGLFYLASALMIPLRAAHRGLFGTKSHMSTGRSMQLFLIAVAMLIGTWLTGLMVGALLQQSSQPTAFAAGYAATLRTRFSMMQFSALAIWIGTLAVVLVAVQVARVTLGAKRAARRRDARSARTPTRASAERLLVVLCVGGAAAFADVSPVEAQATRGVDAVIVSLEDSVAAHPGDEAAWQQLALQRRRAGRLREAIDALATAQRLHETPRREAQLALWRSEAGMQVEPALSATHDSDGNSTARGSAMLRFPTVGRGAIAVSAGAVRATNTGERASLQTASLHVSWRPRATTQLEAAAGAAFLRSESPVVSPSTTPTASARVRYRSSPRGVWIDLRGSRAVLDATPLLVTNRVARNEGSVALEVPVIGNLRARGLARSGQVQSPAEPANDRTLLGGGVLYALNGWGEFGLNAQQIRMARATTQGYFAPRKAQVAEIATYLERESDSGVLLAIDAGVGMQRLQAFDMAAISGWEPAARLWTHLDVPMRSNVLLRAEVDVYDGGVQRDVAVSATHWRWVSGGLGLRIRR